MYTSSVCCAAAGVAFFCVKSGPKNAALQTTCIVAAKVMAFTAVTFAWASWKRGSDPVSRQWLGCELSEIPAALCMTAVVAVKVFAASFFVVHAHALMRK